MIVDWYDTSYKNKVSRDGGGWEELEGFIEDETRSGKKKRRMAHYMGNRPFTLKITFKSVEDYENFHNWYQTVCLFGVNSFRYPKIDKDDSSVIAVYKFKKGGQPKYSNPSGKKIECSMEWEEV